MGFFGSGVPVIELIDSTEAIKRTLTLTHPIRGGRVFDWIEENDTRTNPLTGKLLRRFLGYRPILRLRYEGEATAINDTIEDVVDIANSKLNIRVKPYNDVAIVFMAMVSFFKYEHADGLVSRDAVEIEFKGLERKDFIPSLDTYYTISFRKIIVAGA